MRVLVIGASGMLGHEVVRTLSARHDVTAMVRQSPPNDLRIALAGCRIVGGFDVRNPNDWRRGVSEIGAQVVINCAGIVKQRSADPADCIAVNALFPHQLASFCAERETRLIHISTDCVFSGRRGDYRESDEPDPIDLYGRSKLLGELDSTGSLTIRTSMIGLELMHHRGLVEWFLAQHGTVNGYRRAIWNGFTTTELARILAGLIERNDQMTGVWHVSSAPISKYHLLTMLGDQLGRGTLIVPDDSVVIDRSLNSERFRQSTGYEPPTHERMLEELAGAIRAREEHRVA